MVWSAGGSGGLTTAELDAALATQTTAIDTSLATQTTAIDTSIVDELDSTSRNFMRLRTATVTTANVSTTFAGGMGYSGAHLVTLSLVTPSVVPPATSDIDYTDIIMIIAMNVFFDLANSDTAQFAYCQLRVMDLMSQNVPITYNYDFVSAKDLKKIQWPISMPLVPDYPNQTRPIEVELRGTVQASGTMSATDISFKYWMIKGA